MKNILPVIIFLAVAFSVSAQAQTLVLRDGKTLIVSKIRRDGPTLMVTIPIGSGVGEVGYAVAQVASIDFPEPPALKEAATLIASNKPEQALAVIEPVFAAYRPFKDIKGNFWGNAALVKLSLLMALGRDKDADALIRDMLTNRENPDVISAAAASQTLVLARLGKSKEAIAASNELINQESADSNTLSIAYVASGDAHLALKEYEEAAFAYLHLPIFFPDQKLLMPAALLGSARAFAKLDVKTELDSAIQNLTQSYPTSPEAITAKSEFPNVISRIQKPTK